MTQNWLSYYQSNYRPLLESAGLGKKFSDKRGLVDGLYHRADGFDLIFELLENLNQTEYHIIETGTLRNPGNWKDGQSALLFTEFVASKTGSVRSVDIDPVAVANAKSAITGQHFSVTCSDSVIWLQQQSNLSNVDLFYLDSWDVKWEDDHNSAEHHLREFLAIEPYLKSGAIVAIDDNSRFLSTNARTGKGRRIVEYLESKQIQPVYDAYQIIYKF